MVNDSMKCIQGKDHHGRLEQQTLGNCSMCIDSNRFLVHIEVAQVPVGGISYMRSWIFGMEYGALAFSRRGCWMDL